MNELATQLAFDPVAMSEEVHEAEEGNGNKEGEQGGEVGVQVIFSCFEFSSADIQPHQRER